MKTLFLIYLIVLTSCRTTKIDTGKTILTANQIHWNRVYPHGQKVHNKNLQPIILTARK